MNGRKRHASILAAAGLGLAALAAGCAGPANGARGRGAPETATGSAPTVLVTHPRPGVLERRMTLPGTVRAYQEATLYAKVAGYLKSIAVDRGDRVKAGEELARLELPEMEAEIGKLEAEVAVAKAEYTRVSEASRRAPDLVTPQALDGAKGRYDVALANLGRTRTLMGYATLTAPFAGVVTERWVDAGAFIPAATASSSAKSAAVVTVADFSRVRIEVAMPDTEVPLVKAGLPATVTVQELPGKRFEGQVTRIAYALDDSTRTMGTEIEMPNPGALLRPGMYASVTIGLQRKEGALLVPAEAVVTREGKPFAFVVDGGKARKVALRTGLDDGIKIEVLDGLAVGDAVVVSAGQGLTDGQACQAVEAR